jgi:RES domain-containing protein
LKIPTLEFSGIVYRAHHPMWSYQPLSGEGAKRHGGRFNRLSKSALYTSLDPTTAWMEAQQGFPFKPQPMTLIAYQVDCTDLVDLTQTKIQKFLGQTTASLACAWEDMAMQKQEPPTWVLAEQLQDMGIVGAITQSYAPGCKAENRNLVLWDWSDTQPHCITVIDDFGRLPKSDDSWLHVGKKNQD